VKVSAFARTTGGSWSTAYLGSYGGGLGVTDGADGDGSNNEHTVDNVGRVDYVMFEFSQPVVVNKAFLGYVVGDSDMSVWIGNASNPFVNHLTLSDTLLAGYGREDNDTTLTTTRWADFNATEVMGNVLVIAASVSDDTPDDRFKIQNLEICANVGQTCPSPWASKDQDCTKGGYSSCNNGIFTIKGAGCDVWGTSDQFRYCYQPASGELHDHRPLHDGAEHRSLGQVRLDDSRKPDGRLQACVRVRDARKWRGLPMPHRHRRFERQCKRDRALRALLAEAGPQRQHVHLVLLVQRHDLDLIGITDDLDGDQRLCRPGWYRAMTMPRSARRRLTT